MVMDQDPMESLPAPDIVGREFVRQYYTLLNEAPEHAHRFYNSNSYFVHGAMTKPAIGQLEIHQKIQQLNFRDCHAKISQVDSQVTLGNGVVVQVSGELSNDGLPMRRFSQTFVLGTQSPKKYYVHNDIFRYQDMLQSDEEADAQPDKDEQTDIEQQEPQAYYPSAPLEQVAPPQPQVPAGLNVNAPPHVNLNVNGTSTHPHYEDPVPVPEPVLLDVVQAPVVNGGVREEELSKPLPPLASEPPQMQRPGPTHIKEEPAVQPLSEIINNKDVYEDDYPAQNLDSNDSKPTFANLFKPARASRGPPPARAVRTAPPSQPAPPVAQPSQHGPSSYSASVPSQRPDLPSDPSGNPRHSYPDSQQVFMGNIPTEVTDNDLRPIFAEFGRVIDVRINSNRTRENGSRNYGFVTFEDAASVSKCLNNKHIMWHQTPINVEEKKRQTKPGGGRGEAGHEGGWGMGRGQAGRGRGPPRGAPRGSSYARGSAPLPPRPPTKR